MTPIAYEVGNAKPSFLVIHELSLRESSIAYGSVEKSRQRRSRHFSVLTYDAYAPRVKMAAALLDGLF